MAQAKENVTTIAEIAPLRPFDDAAALEWLRAQPGGSTKLKPGELGSLWGWDKMQVGRRLPFWQRRGVITRKRKTIMVVDGVSAVEVLAPRPATRPKAAPRPALVREREAFSLPVPIALRPIHDALPSAPTGASKARSVSTVVLCLFAYLVAVSLAVVAVWFSIRGMIVLFPGALAAIVAMGVALEVGKLVSVAFLAHQWSRLGPLSRATLIGLVAGLAAINAVGVYSQLVAPTLATG